jgi:hypothetical protein
MRRRSINSETRKPGGEVAVVCVFLVSWIPNLFFP